MVTPTVPMSLCSDFTSYPFSPTMSLPWVPHSVHPAQSPFKLFTPHPYMTPRHSGLQTLPAPELINGAGHHSMMRRKSNSRKIGSKPSYKHVPHKDKPPHLVARRNARERRRVEAVNSAFARLRKCVPIENRNKRLSKVKTLHRAIEYIKGLQSMLSDNSDASDSVHYSRHRYESVTSPDDDDDVDDEEAGEAKEEREDSEFAEFEEYLESDIDVVNKENKDQGWNPLSSGCDSNYWTYNMPYGEDYSTNLTS